MYRVEQAVYDYRRGEFHWVPVALHEDLDRAERNTSCRRSYGESIRIVETNNIDMVSPKTGER
jgi:hypothetical protein